MPWLVLDIALVLLSLAVLGLLGLRLWRQVKQLSREVAAATARIAPLLESLTVSPRPESATAREKPASRVG